MSEQGNVAICVKHALNGVFERKTGENMASVRFGKMKIRVPKSPIVRQGMGVGLVVGGIFGFLPVLGFWMIPLGVGVLSVDNPPLRRLRRKTEVWFARRRRNKQQDQGES